MRAMVGGGGGIFAKLVNLAVFAPKWEMGWSLRSKVARAQTIIERERRNMDREEGESEGVTYHLHFIMHFRRRKVTSPHPFN